MANNKPIQLTEQDLHYLVEDAVKLYLQENQTDEFLGGMGSMFGAARNAVQQKYNAAKTGMQNLGQNMANTYRQGNLNAKIQKQGQYVENVVNQFIETAESFNNAELVTASRNYIAQIKQIMNNSNERLQAVQGRTFSTQNYQGQ